MTSVRKLPPLPYGRSGGCLWCGKPVPNGPTGRKRGWHPECLSIYMIATQSRSQRNACLNRDGGRCHDCGAMCYRPGRGSTFYPDDGGGPYRLPDTHEKAEYPFSRVAWVETKLWNAEHDVPLWSVDRSLPWEKLIFYWSIGNLLTRCVDCHATKTAQEAKQRAKEARIRAKRGHPDPKRLKVRDLPF